jgi:hypothetical protein
MATATGLPSDRRIETIEAFWPYYLQEHAKPLTRALHYTGTLLATFSLLGFFLTGDLRLLLAFPVLGYGFAWAAHFFVEKNRPATFTYPLWSLLCDYRMAFSWLTGHIAEDLERAGVNESRA